MIFREFLNPLGHDDKGSITVESNSYGLVLSIKDCARTISLDFSTNSPKELQNRYNKIKVIREALTVLETELKKTEL